MLFGYTSGTVKNSELAGRVGSDGSLRRGGGPFLFLGFASGEGASFDFAQDERGGGAGQVRRKELTLVGGVKRQLRKRGERD